jgi:hypothetical protein
MGGGWAQSFLSWENQLKIKIVHIEINCLNVIYQYLSRKWEFAETSQGWNLCYVKQRSPNSFRRYEKCIMPTFPPYGAIFYELQEQSQLLNRWIFLTRILLKMSIWWLYTRKHDILAKQKPLTRIVVVQRYSDMLFWGACAKNVKYYKL